jgi:hypothetical protein
MTDPDTPPAGRRRATPTDATAATVAFARERHQAATARLSAARVTAGAARGSSNRGGVGAPAPR